MAKPETDSIARNAAYAFAIQITTAAFTAVLTLYLARTLGPGRFGVFSLALSIGGLLLLPSDFGVSQSVARFAAERRGNLPALGRLMRDAMKLKFLFAGATCALMFAVAGPVANAYDEPALGWTLRAMAVAVLGQSVMQLYGGVFSGLAQTSRSFRMVFSKSVVETGASIALVAAGAGASGAAFGRAIGYVVGAAVGAATMLAFIGRRRSAAPEDHVGVRRIAGYATAILVVDAAYTLFQQVDILLIGAIMSATAAGLYQAPLRFIALLHYPGYALAGGVAPRMAADSAEGPRADAFVYATRYITLFQAALLAPVVVWADPIIDLLLGSDYADSAEVLRALAPYVFMMGLAPLFSLSANYLGQAGRRVPIAIATVVVNIAIDVVLIPKIGIVAGAIGTDVSYAIYVPAQLWVVLRVLGVPFQPILVTLARSLVAAAGMAGVLALFGTSTDVGVPFLIVGSGAGAIVYLALLVLTRELSLEELRAAPGAIRRRLGRAGA